MVFDYFQKIKDYCLDKATELSKQEYTSSSNIDALIMLFYFIKESNQTDKYAKMYDILSKEKLSAKQKLLVETINSLPY